MQTVRRAHTHIGDLKSKFADLQDYRLRRGETLHGQLSSTVPIVTYVVSVILSGKSENMSVGDHAVISTGVNNRRTPFDPSLLYGDWYSPRATL